jgi:hypothetical protein
MLPLWSRGYYYYPACAAYVTSKRATPFSSYIVLSLQYDTIIHIAPPPSIVQPLYRTIIGPCSIPFWPLSIVDWFMFGEHRTLTNNATTKKHDKLLQQVQVKSTIILETWVAYRLWKGVVLWIKSGRIQTFGSHSKQTTSTYVDSLQYSSRKERRRKMHLPSLLIGSVTTGSGFLLIHRELSHRQRLSSRWILAEVVEREMNTLWVNAKTSVPDKVSFCEGNIRKNIVWA